MPDSQTDGREVLEKLGDVSSLVTTPDQERRILQTLTDRLVAIVSMECHASNFKFVGPNCEITVTVPRPKLLSLMGWDEPKGEE